jgi:hypothetical protein
MMKVNISVEKNDIIIVEKMDDIEKNEIIFNNEVKLKIRMNGNNKVMDGCVKDLKIY